MRGAKAHGKTSDCEPALDRNNGEKIHHGLKISARFKLPAWRLDELTADWALAHRSICAAGGPFIADFAMSGMQDARECASRGCRTAEVVPFVHPVGTCIRAGIANRTG